MIFFIAVIVKDNKESFLSHTEAHFLDGIQNINAHNQQLKAAVLYSCDSLANFFGIVTEVVAVTTLSTVPHFTSTSGRQLSIT